MVHLPKEWILKETDFDLIDEIAGKFNISRITATIMVNRGVNSTEEANKFFNPDLLNLQEPFLLPDMDKAVARLRKAVDNNERILVYGDKDADGITAVSIMLLTLKSLGNNPSYYIPSQEGYGLHKKVIDDYAGKADLLVTVDCGISCSQEISYAREKGIDVIVTDHHEIPYKFDGIPDAVAVINPKRKDCLYQFKDLAGCLVAFKTAQGLMLSYEENFDRASGTAKQIWSRRMEFFLKEHLDLISIGTIGDMMPLVNENRTLVKHGLKFLKSSRKPGIKTIIGELFRFSDIITSKDVSYNIVPVFNSCGRLDRSGLAVELLTSDSLPDSEKILGKMLQLNDNRRSLQETGMGVIKQLINEQCNIESDKLIFIKAEKIEPGITGIIATQLAHKYKRPIILVNIEGEEATGNCRSTGNFDIYRALETCKDLLLKFGGHQQAAGFTIKKENIGLLKKTVNAFAEAELTPGSLAQKIEIDMVLRPEEINSDLAREISELEPFGHSNPYPVFMLKNIKIEESSRLGHNNKMLKFRIKANNMLFNAISSRNGYSSGNAAFDDGESTDLPLYADLAFQLQMNKWQERNQLQFFVVDMRPCL